MNDVCNRPDCANGWIPAIVVRRAVYMGGESPDGSRIVKEYEVADVRRQSEFTDHDSLWDHDREHEIPYEAAVRCGHISHVGRPAFEEVRENVDSEHADVFDSPTYVEDAEAEERPTYSRPYKDD